MSRDLLRVDPTVWRPQSRFSIDLSSNRQVNDFNDKGGIAVYIDTGRTLRPDIIIHGSQSAKLSFWETRSASGFVSKPKFVAGLLTIRFVTSGTIVYQLRRREFVASPVVAALTSFDDLTEVRASCAVGTVSATIAIDALATAQTSLTGEDRTGLPVLAPIADMALPGLAALFATIRLVQRRIREHEQDTDLMLPLLQEIVSYQLLSTWPKLVEAKVPAPADIPSRQLRLAIDYIEANLSTALTLSDVAAAAGVGVRALQNKFKQETSRTPVQFIIERRLSRARADLVSAAEASRPIAEIARQYGFAHMSDFSQRFRRQYGHTPTEARREADGATPRAGSTQRGAATRARPSET